MKKEILLFNGERKFINEDLRSINEASCLTCGRTNGVGEKRLIRVGDKEKLQPWLKRRLHNVNKDTNVILCSFCINEFLSIPTWKNKKEQF